MAEEFESLDAAAVAGAHGSSLGWGGVPVLLSPVDVFSTSEVAHPAPPPHHHHHSHQQHTFDLEHLLVKAQAQTPPMCQTNSNVAVPLAPAPKKRRLSRAEEEMAYGQLQDIGGTTAARSRQMTEEERKVMLYKRKLRNRASAARSREKRCRTIRELSNEVAGLLENSNQIAMRCARVRSENERLQRENEMVREENDRLRQMLDTFQVEPLKHNEL